MGGRLATATDQLTTDHEQLCNAENLTHTIHQVASAWWMSLQTRHGAPSFRERVG